MHANPDPISQAAETLGEALADADVHTSQWSQPLQFLVSLARAGAGGNEALCPHGVARILGPCAECDPECAALIDGRKDRPCPNAHLPDSLYCAAHGGAFPVVSLTVEQPTTYAVQPVFSALLLSFHIRIGMLPRVLSVQVHRLALALEERAMACEQDPGWRITISHGLAQLRIEPAQKTRWEIEKAAALVRETLEEIGLKHNPSTGRWARE
jgi:hypothetical protein